MSDQRPVDDDPKNVFKLFTDSYIECLLWSSLVTLEEGEEPVHADDHFSIGDLSPEAMQEIKIDCEQFLLDNQGKWLAGGWTNEQAGHDFCLTRNHHGAGFWDRGWNYEVGEELTFRCRPYGEQHLYLGDDEKLYIE